MSMPEKIGKYAVEGILGRGGMGVVYKCYDEAIDRRIAIKAITKSDMDSDELKHAIERFRHEAKAVGRLMHPNIVQIYDYAEDDQLAYIVMELVKGRTLLEHFKAGKTYQLNESGEILRQILAGMGHAHSQGVIHRDIKPSNIMINEEGAVKVADFGIARTESSSLTQVGDVLGTLYYMSPEQLLGSDVTVVTDIYAIGVIAYELFTGQRPFGGNSAQVMQRVLNELPENPSMLNLKLSPAVDRVLQRALAKKPQDRFQTAEEFARQLRYAVDGVATMGLGMGKVRAGSAEKPLDPSVEWDEAPVSGQTASVGNAPDQSLPGASVLDAARLLTPTASTSAFAPISSDAAVRLPASPLAPNTGGSISLDNSVRKARVLFIDDEERILSALKSLFRDRYHVFTTTDCQKALDFVSKYEMHVIVSDQRMPEMLGVEFLRRSREISPNSVRILLTGYSDLAAIVGSMNDGEVYRFISKPWDNTELRNTLGEAVTIGLELANAKSGEVSVPERMEAGVLVIDQNEDLSRVVKELVGGICPVSYANSVETAIDTMQNQEVALIITDVDFAQDQLTTMLKLLKQENPQVLTIVVTSASDSELVIELINEAQVFRFLNKPVNVALMRTHIQAALKRYLSFKSVPALARTQKVEVVSEIRESTFGQSVVKRISGARERWRARAAAAARRRAALQ